MSPDDRRKEIIDAVIPILLKKGSPLTTREIAEAAGVAEGTVFSVFPDKASVIVEAVKATMAPEAVRDALATIPPDVPFEQQLEMAAAVLIERSETVSTLIGVLRSVQPTGSRPPQAAHRFITESHTALIDALTVLFEQHTDLLRVEPRRAARTLWSLAFSNAHPLMAGDERSDSDEIVDMVLHGIARHGSRVGA
jgi:AcrR family transcriptional regulator